MADACELGPRDVPKFYGKALGLKPLLVAQGLAMALPAKGNGTIGKKQMQCSAIIKPLTIFYSCKKKYRNVTSG